MDKNNNKPHFDKQRSQVPPRIASRANQFGSKNRRSIPRSK